MTNRPAYDPFPHVARLGIQIIDRPLSVNGYWVPERRVILLNTKLATWHRRQVCTHEIGHAVLGHRGCGHPVQERQANRWAYRKLIDHDVVRDLAAMTPDAGVWALELGVTEDLLELWMRDNHRAIATTTAALESPRLMEWA